MDFKKIKKTFKVVGLKGNGAYENFAEEVPTLAKQLLRRCDEIDSHLSIEIALFEPKRDNAQKRGNYLVGLIVNDSIKGIPTGMVFIEVEQHYVTTRGKISSIGTLHFNLMKWADEQGYKRNLESYIVETYHPMEDEEEVEIYLPIY